jgi:uncharacterized membrane protein YfcA
MELAQDLSHFWLLILVAVAFLAGYVDAIAGGGGMVLIPALLFAGVPAVSAMAVNKIVAIAGTSLAVIKYALAKQVHWRLVLWSLLPCLLASFLGGKLALSLSEEVLVWMILLCIPVALYFVLTGRKAQSDNSDHKITKAGLILSPIGFYDGLLGPGTGTYMTIAMRRFLSMDYLRATATTKPLNLATNIGAAIAFLLAGKVIWALAVPMLLANAAGAWVGSHFAIKNGDSFIRKMLVIVLVVMLVANVIKLIVS